MPELPTLIKSQKPNVQNGHILDQLMLMKSFYLKINIFLFSKKSKVGPSEYKLKFGDIGEKPRDKYEDENFAEKTR